MHYLSKPFFILCSATIVIAASSGAAPQNATTAASNNSLIATLQTAQPLLPSDALAKLKLGTTPVARVDVTGQTFAQSTHIVVPQTEGDSNQIQININNVAPVKKGDNLLALITARGQATKGAAQMMFMFERNHDPWTKSASQGLKLPSDGQHWRRFAVPFAAQEDYAAGEVMGTLRLAFGEQNLEIGEFQILDFGASKTLEQLQTLAVQLSPLGTVNVQVNRQEKRQIIKALGGNYTGAYRVAYGEPNDAIAQITRKELKPDHARLGMSLIAWQPEENGPFDTNSKSGQLLKLAGEFAKGGVPMVLSIWEAPKWMTTTLNGKNTLDEAKWDAAISAIAEWLVRARDEQKATIDYVSFNEADIGIDLHFTPQRMAAFIKRAVPEFQKRGLKTLWLAGDTGNGSNCVAWTRPQLEDPTVRPFLGPLVFHGWDALSASDATYENIAELGKEFNREVWCLEAGSDAQAWRIQPAVWPTWDYAIKVAQSYAKTIGPARAQVLDYWTYRDDYPLANKDGTLYPALHVLQQFQTYFGKGTQIIGATSDNADVSVISGLRPDGSVLVMLVNAGGDGEARIGGFEPYPSVIARSTTDAQKPTVTEEQLTRAEAENRGLAGGKGGGLSVPLPMRSVTVLIVQRWL